MRSHKLGSDPSTESEKKKSNQLAWVLRFVFGSVEVPKFT
jgi:hypothetical protein